MAPAAQQASFLQDAGTWKFAAGVVIGYCVRVVTSRLHLQVRSMHACMQQRSGHCFIWLGCWKLSKPWPTLLDNDGRL